MSIEGKLAKLGLTLPEATAPIGTYTPYKVVDNKVYLSGQGPFLNGESMYSGKLGVDVSVEEGYKAAELCVLNLLAQIKVAIGSLDKITQVINVRGYVACATDFYAHPSIINGASDLLVALFGEKGKHVRVAIGSNVLPVNIPVEVEMTVEFKE